MSSAPAFVIIDDSDDDVFFCTKIIRSAGLTNPIISFADPVAALEFFSDYVPGAAVNRIGMVFCDVKMPRVTGLELLEWFRRQPTLSEIAFVVMSGANLPSDRERALDLGARAYVPKFPQPNEIASLVAAARIGLNQCGGITTKLR